jgi:hypothetical protein
MKNKPDPLSCDPMHSERNLQNGLYIAEQYLGFSLRDVALLFWHSRPAAIGCLAQLGEVLLRTADKGRSRRRSDKGQHRPQARVRRVMT